MAKVPTKKVKTLAKPRAPTTDEREAIAAAEARQLERPLRVQIAANLNDVGGEPKVTLSPPHDDHNGWAATLFEAMGTCSSDFANYALQSVGGVLNPDGKQHDRYTVALALIGAIDPKNELETAIASQMVATHALSMEIMGRAARAGMRDACESYVTQATKLSRTFMQLAEGLNKLRNGGKQQVEVRYVYVDARGSNNLIAPGGVGEKFGQPQEPAGVSCHAPAPGLPLWGEDAGGLAMPAPGFAGSGQVQASWGQEHRGAQGGLERQLPNGALHGGASILPPPRDGSDTHGEDDT